MTPFDSIQYATEPSRAVAELARVCEPGGGEVSCPFTFRDISHAWEADTSAGRLQKVIDMVGAVRVQGTLTSVLEADRKQDGQLRQDTVFRYVIATTPEEEA